MPRQLLFPDLFQFAVVRMDACAMVEPLKDPIAMEAARALKCKKYLVYLVRPQDLPMPQSKYCRFRIKPIATGLRPVDPAQGITSDMVMPIHPNTECLKGRTPIVSYPPFPFDNCFFWVESQMSVRVKVNRKGYEDGQAFTIGARGDLTRAGCWTDDFERIDSFVENQQAKFSASPPPAASPALPYSSAIFSEPESSSTTSLSESSQSSDDELAEGSVDGDVCRSSVLPSEDAAELKQLFSLNLFGWDHDPKAKYLPLVDLWLDITQHLTAETIPSPEDFYKERADIGLIISASLRRRRSKSTGPQKPLIGLPNTLPSASSSESRTTEDVHPEDNTQNHVVKETTADFNDGPRKRLWLERLRSGKLSKGFASFYNFPLRGGGKPSRP